MGTIQNRTVFTPKKSSEAYQIGFDFSGVIGSATISSAAITATDETINKDVSTTLLDVTLQSISTPYVYGWVRNGIGGHDHLIVCDIVCSDGSLYGMAGSLHIEVMPPVTATTLDRVIDHARYILNNFEPPWLWQDRELVFYANEARNIICRDAKILEDSTTGLVCNIPTVSGQMDYLYDSRIIYIKSVRLVVTELMTLDVAPATAWAVGATLTGLTSGSSCVVVANITPTTYTVKQRTGEFVLGEIITDGVTAADQGAAKPTFADNSQESKFLDKYTKEEMDRCIQGWRIPSSEKPNYYVVDYNTGYMSIYPTPNDIWTMTLSVIRYPLYRFDVNGMDLQDIEIARQYQNVLVDGICYQAYLKSGENTYDAKKSANHYQLFRKGILSMKIQSNLFESNAATAGPLQGFI